MATAKDAGKKFPHVKGLAKKTTKFGHRWILTEPDSMGKLRSITVKILDTDDVATFYAKVNEARNRLRAKNKDERFGELVEEYICMRQMADSTSEYIRRFLRPFGFDSKKNKKAVMDILTSSIRKTTTGLKIGCIRRFYRWLVSRGEQVQDPTDGILLKTPLVARMRTATKEEIDRLLQYTRSRMNKEYLLFVLLLIHTGARVSSILALKACDLDDSNRLQLYNVKTKKPYSYKIPIHNDEIVRLWREISQDGVLWHDGAEIFGKRLLKVMARIFPRDANGENLTPHSLRHTFATNAIRSGVPLEIVSKLLDHSSMSITLNVYAKFSQEQIDESISKIEEGIYPLTTTP